MSNLLILAAAIPGLLAPAATVQSAAVPTLDTAVAASTNTSARIDTRRYCIDETMTDSRIPKRTCQSRAQWANEGVDVDAK